MWKMNWCVRTRLQRPFGMVSLAGSNRLSVCAPPTVRRCPTVASHAVHTRAVEISRPRPTHFGANASTFRVAGPNTPGNPGAVKALRREIRKYSLVRTSVGLKVGHSFYTIEEVEEEHAAQPPSVALQPAPFPPVVVACSRPGLLARLFGRCLMPTVHTESRHSLAKSARRLRAELLATASNASNCRPDSLQPASSPRPHE